MHIPSLLRPSAALVTKTVRRARAGTAMAAPFSAPRTSFNGTITRRRTIAFAAMPPDEVRAPKAATGATVNDVVLSIPGGALQHRHAALRERVCHNWYITVGAHT